MFLKNVLYIWLFKTVNCVHMFENILLYASKKDNGGFIMVKLQYGNANMVSIHKQTDLCVCMLDVKCL